MREKNGFTLTELLVTVAMLAVLGTIIIASAIGITNSSKETQYKRMIENITNSTKTYVSLYPDEFGELYSSRAFYYVPLKKIIAAGLLDEEIINPYTKKQVDLDQVCDENSIKGENICLSTVKVYVDGDTFEMTYKYPLTHDDFNSIIWLRLSSIVVSATDEGYEPVFAYSGLDIEGNKPTNNFAFSKEDGTLISADVGKTLLTQYKSDYSITYEMPSSFISCTNEDNPYRDTLCKDISVPTGASLDDYFIPTKTGTFEIKYKWNYTLGGNTIYRSDTRKVRVMSATDEEKEKEKTNVKTTTTKFIPADEEGIILRTSGRFDGIKSTDTGIPLLQPGDTSNFPNAFTLIFIGTVNDNIRNQDVIIDMLDKNKNGFIVYYDSTYGIRITNYKNGAVYGNTGTISVTKNVPFGFILTYGGEGEPLNSMGFYYVNNMNTATKLTKSNNVSLGTFTDVDMFIGGYRNDTKCFSGTIEELIVYNQSLKSAIDASL